MSRSTSRRSWPKRRDRVLTTPALWPLIGLQALWVMARARRLPEAAGPRQGQTGTGPSLRLLILGDSSAAGVGAAHQDQALAGRLRDRLSEHFSLQWRLLARSGATTRTALRLLDTLPPARFDAVVIALGVNDTKNGLSLPGWQANYGALIDRLENRFGARTICLSGVPPLQHFPALPNPLRDVLGRRAARLDTVLRQMAHTRPNLHHVPLDFDLDPKFMAPDGFHPGPPGYDEWARRLAPYLTT